MFKTLIADTEEMLRRDLARLLERDGDFTVCAQADSGEKALELAELYVPDLILIDIDMPLLKSPEHVQRLWNSAGLVVVVGYDDFGYRQRALHLGAYECIVKPVFERGFSDMLGRVKTQLRLRRCRYQYLSWVEEKHAQNRPALVAAFLDNLSSGTAVGTEIKEQLQYLDIVLPEQFGMAVVQISYDEHHAAHDSRWDREQLLYAAENIANEIMAPLAPVTVCRNRKEQIVVISAGRPLQIWNNSFGELAAALERHLPVRVRIGAALGEECSELSFVYANATERLDSVRKYSSIVEEAIRYIEWQYGNPDLSLQLVARAIHVSPQHLSRIFRHETGVRFVDFVTHTRIRRASALLLDSELRVYEVAERVGYSTQHYFSSVFKHLLGMPPMEYRRNRKSRAQIAAAPVRSMAE